MKVKDCERRRFEVKEYENILSGLKGINWFHFKKSKINKECSTLVSHTRKSLVQGERFWVIIQGETRET